MTIPVDLVLNPVDASWSQVLDAARAGVDAGYAGLWVLDHVSGVPFDAATTSECFTLLGALAVAIPDVPIGALVANAASRPIAVTALAFETLARIAGDRLRIAVGAGAGSTGMFAMEHEVLGSSPGSLRERHQRVERLIAELRSRPALADRPVIVGANSGPLSAIAGRIADGLNIGVDHPRRSELLATAREHAARAFGASAWARWRPDLLDESSDARRSLTDDGVSRLMLAMRPVELSGPLPGPRR